MNINTKLFGIIFSCVIAVFGAWIFIEDKIDEKVDKETFELKIQLKQLRIDNVEEVLEEKLKVVKENQAKILEKLEEQYAR